jgi:hypothetical protein
MILRARRNATALPPPTPNADLRWTFGVLIARQPDLLSIYSLAIHVHATKGKHGACPFMRSQPVNQLAGRGWLRCFDE